ncbi:hypothetical protein [Microcoleus sp. SVA1_A4]|uniref:hypothetical protein n=1 Tax=Microcoleus sp. SVA1_A4 TaxID=2818948 RepID=UPI002FD2DB42
MIESLVRRALLRPPTVGFKRSAARGTVLILGDRASSFPKSSPPISVNNFTYNELQISCEI